MVNTKEKVNMVKIVYPGLDKMPDDIYANNVRVSYNIGSDFVLYFAKIDAPPLIEGEKIGNEEVMAKVVARIRLTPQVAEALLNVLKQTVESFKQSKNQYEEE